MTVEDFLDKLEIGTKVECCLDSEIPVGTDYYTGIINNVDYNEYTVSIKRDDGIDGDGYNGSWRTIINEENMHHLKITGRILGDWDV